MIIKPARSILTKLAVTCFLLSGICSHANAQKLPNVQQASLRAPADIKIDGKASEWGNQFAAYNKTAEVFYTIANDVENMYLVVKAVKGNIIEKIVKGGITLSIDTTDKKKDVHCFDITFPAYGIKESPLFLILNNRPVPTNDSVKYKFQVDSFKNARNRQLTEHCKMIEIIGIKSIEDSLISIYNDYGIKVSSHFDNKLNYTVELAIPLKYLGPKINHFATFAYHIKLNGPAFHGTNIQILDRGSYQIFTFTRRDGVTYMIPPSQGMESAVPTDFWGEYTLARK